MSTHVHLPGFNIDKPPGQWITGPDVTYEARDPKEPIDLYDWQDYAYGYLRPARHSLIAALMGSGKSLVGCCLIHEKLEADKRLRAIIVVPQTIIGHNFSRELWIRLGNKIIHWAPHPNHDLWDHSEHVLVFYPAIPEAQLVDRFSVAYYHYKLPEGPRWLDFEHMGREPSHWWPLPAQPVEPIKTSTIEVTISGAAKTGKTKLLRFLATRLKEAGCDVQQPPASTGPSDVSGLQVEFREQRLSAPTSLVEPVPPATDCCADWAPQTKKIDDFILLACARAGRDLFDGKIFQFCPWCGKPRPPITKTTQPQP